MNALSVAVSVVGSQRELARRLNVTASAVNQCLNGRCQIPAAWCPQIEAITGRRVLCEELRPDIQWGVLRAPMPAPGKEEQKGAAR